MTRATATFLFTDIEGSTQLLNSHRAEYAEILADHHQTSDPGSATRAWSEIEHDLVDDAALVPVLNPISTFVVSDRAGNVRINPGLGVLLGQIWVR